MKFLILLLFIFNFLLSSDSSINLAGPSSLVSYNSSDTFDIDERTRFPVDSMESDVILEFESLKSELLNLCQRDIQFCLRKIEDITNVLSFFQSLELFTLSDDKVLFKNTNLKEYNQYPYIYGQWTSKLKRLPQQISVMPLTEIRLRESRIHTYFYDILLLLNQIYKQDNNLSLTMLSLFINDLEALGKREEYKGIISK